jgi:hypothetical protein
MIKRESDIQTEILEEKTKEYNRRKVCNGKRDGRRYNCKIVNAE